MIDSAETAFGPTRSCFDIAFAVGYGMVLGKGVDAAVGSRQNRVYVYRIDLISSEKSYGPDPFILHSLVSGRVEALK